MDFMGGQGLSELSNLLKESEQAKAVGAQFWIFKSDDIEPRLQQFYDDYASYRNGTGEFKIYR